MLFRTKNSHNYLEMEVEIEIENRYKSKLFPAFESESESKWFEKFKSIQAIPRREYASWNYIRRPLNLEKYASDICA
jgi:hypothetical protein